MAECGIEKYDKLPAVVPGCDVDYLRWVYSSKTNIHRWQLRVGSFVAKFLDYMTLPRMSALEAKDRLEFAYQMHKKLGGK
jgi:hypothetical protein